MASLRNCPAVASVTPHVELLSLLHSSSCISREAPSLLFHGHLCACSIRHNLRCIKRVLREKPELDANIILELNETGQHVQDQQHQISRPSWSSSVHLYSATTRSGRHLLLLSLFARYCLRADSRAAVIIRFIGKLLFPAANQRSFPSSTAPNISSIIIKYQPYHDGSGRRLRCHW